MTPGAPTVQLRVWLCSFCPLPPFPNFLKLSIPGSKRLLYPAHSSAALTTLNLVVKRSKPSEQSDAQLFNTTHLGTIILKAQVWVSFCCQLYICATTNCSFFCLGVFNFLPASSVFHVARSLQPPYKGCLSGIYQSYLECEKIRWSTRSWEFQKVEIFSPWYTETFKQPNLEGRCI